LKDASLTKRHTLSDVRIQKNNFGIKSAAFWGWASCKPHKPSPLWVKSDISNCDHHVRFTPIADISPLFGSGT